MIILRIRAAKLVCTYLASSLYPFVIATVESCSPADGVPITSADQEGVPKHLWLRITALDLGGCKYDLSQNEHCFAEIFFFLGSALKAHGPKEPQIC